MPIAIPQPKKVFKRGGNVTKVEQNMVGQFVRDLKKEITPAQVNALAKLTNRPPKTIKKVIERAREQFAEAAQDYVETHLAATTGALESGDYETAAKASQWAISNLSAEGVRVIDREDEGQKVPRVMIGIRLGGLEAAKQPEAIVVEAETINEP